VENAFIDEGPETRLAGSACWGTQGSPFQTWRDVGGKPATNESMPAVRYACLRCSGDKVEEGTQERKVTGGFVRCGAAVRGVVQGVGFRRLSFGWRRKRGWQVSSGTYDGVTIEVEGAAARVEAFLRR